MMWRTLLRMKRDTKWLAPPIEVDATGADVPTLEDARKFGEHMLLEDIVTVMHADGTVTQRNHQATMLAADANLAAWDEVVVPFIPSEAKIAVSNTRVVTDDGKTHKVKTGAFPFQQEFEGKNVMARVLVSKYTPLKPGVVVEHEQTMDSWKHDPLGKHMWREYYLRTQPPCQHRRITVAIAESIEADVKVHNGGPEPKESFDRGYHIWRWEMRDTPGTAIDEMTAPVRDFIPWVEITTMRDWSAMTDKYREELWSGVDKQHAPTLAKMLFEGKDTLREKARAAYEYCSKEVRYGRHPDEVNVRETRKMDSMLEDQRGDCKDKSVLLKLLLGEAGIPAELAVVSTIDEGRIEPLPPGRFNHAIVRAELDGEEMWMDPAAGLFSFGDTPSNVQGASMMMLGDDAKVELLRVPESDGSHHGTHRTMSGGVDAEGAMRYAAECELRGDKAAMSRAMLDAEPDKDADEVMSKWIGAGRTGWTFDTMSVQHAQDQLGPFKYRYEATWRDAGRKVHNLLQVSLPWRHPMFSSEAPMAKRRTTPLAVPVAQRHTDTMTLTLPEGYQLASEPEPVALVTPWLEYHIVWRIDGRELQCDRNVVCHGGMVGIDEYEAFREHVEQSLSADRRELVLIPDDAA